jgi:hypothetical protein
MNKAPVFDFYSPVGVVAATDQTQAQIDLLVLEVLKSRLKGSTDSFVYCPAGYKLTQKNS